MFCHLEDNNRLQILHHSKNVYSCSAHKHGRQHTRRRCRSRLLCTCIDCCSSRSPSQHLFHVQFLEPPYLQIKVRKLWEGSGCQIGCFFEKFQTAFDPPASFFENHFATFLCCIWLLICKEVWGPDSMNYMHMISRDRCNTILIQYNTKHTLNPEITLLYQFHAQKTCLKSPKFAI